MVTIPNKENPVLLDQALDEIAAFLKIGCPWFNFCFGKCQIHKELKEGREETTPVIYTGLNEYFSLFPNDKIGNFSFFHSQDPETIADFGKKKGFITANVSLIAWFDFRTIYPTPEADPGATVDQWTVENVKKEVLEALQKARVPLRVQRIYNEADNIYKRFSHKEIQRQFLMRPYGGFKIDLEVKYQLSKC